jgi:hypothetical protein
MYIKVSTNIRKAHLKFDLKYNIANIYYFKYLFILQSSVIQKQRWSCQFFLKKGETTTNIFCARQKSIDINCPY